MMQDIRARAQQGESAAILAIEIYTYRIAGYIGRYWSTLPDADALVFTAGVGENEGYVRARILHWLGNLQMEVDPEKNALRHVETVIGYSRVRSDRPMPVYVIPTDEECVIGYDALYLGYLGRELPDTYPFEAL
jgi:acetate kinase